MNVSFNKIAASLLLAAFFGALAYELLRGLAGPTVRIELSGTATSFDLSARLKSVHYDEDARAIRTSVEITVSGARPEPEIGDLGFSLVRNGDGTTDWMRSSRCTREDGEIVNAPGAPAVPFAMLSCGEILLPTGDVIRERLYPFDSYTVVLRPRGCVNQNDCSSMNNATFRSVEIEVADRRIVPSGWTLDRDVIFALRRPLVIRVVSVLFLVIAVLFLFYIWKITDIKELFGSSIGFFATLWGLRELIVPDSVTVFPTAVDYAVLALYTILFSIVLYQLPMKGDPK